MPPVNPGQRFRFLGTTPAAAPDRLRAQRGGWVRTTPDHRWSRDLWQSVPVRETTAHLFRASIASRLYGGIYVPAGPTMALPPSASGEPPRVMAGPSGDLLAIVDDESYWWTPETSVWRAVGSAGQAQGKWAQPTAAWVGADSATGLVYGPAAGGLWFDDGSGQPRSLFDAFWESQQIDPAAVAVSAVVVVPSSDVLVAVVDTGDGPRFMRGQLSDESVSLGPALDGDNYRMQFDASGHLVVFHKTAPRYIKTQRFDLSQPTWPRAQWTKLSAAGAQDPGRLQDLATDPADASRCAVLWGRSEVHALNRQGTASFSLRRFLRVAPGAPSPAGIAYHPVDGTLIVAHEDGRLTAMDDAGQHDPDYASLVPGITAITFDPSGDFYVTAHQDGMLRRWCAEDHQPWQGTA